MKYCLTLQLKWISILRLKLKLIPIEERMCSQSDNNFGSTDGRSIYRVYRAQHNRGMVLKEFTGPSVLLTVVGDFNRYTGTIALLQNVDSEINCIAIECFHLCSGCLSMVKNKKCDQKMFIYNTVENQN